MTTYRFTIGRWHEPTEESSVAHGMARIVKCGLGHRVIAWEEMELDFAAWRDIEGVGLEGETIFANINGLDGTWR